MRVVVGELQALHGFAWHAEHALQRLARGHHDGQRVPAPDQHHASDPMGEAIGDIIQGRGVKLQCRPYGCRLIEKFRSGRLHPRAQLGVQWVIARQGEDVGALHVGDSLDDGTLAGIERAGGWVEQRARKGTHLGYTVFVRKLDISLRRYTVCVSNV